MHMGIRVAIAGASGYAGGELLRLVAAHPDLEVTAVTAHANAGQTVGEVHPHLRSLAELVFGETSADTLRGADLVFLALPHGASAQLAAALPKSVKIVDLGSDHRLVDAAAHERYYGGDHQPAWTYGLPELPGQRAAIAASERVANTGCHAVAAILAIAPLVAAGLADADDIVVTSASGTSGAGKAALAHLLGSEVMGDLTGYKVGAHRHVPEIKQASRARTLTMTPVLAPMPRGILSTVALRPAGPVTPDDRPGRTGRRLRRRAVRPRPAARAAAAHLGDRRIQQRAPAGHRRPRLRPDHRHERHRQPRQGRRRSGAAERQHHAGPARDRRPHRRRSRAMSERRLRAIHGHCVFAPERSEA